MKSSPISGEDSSMTEIGIPTGNNGGGRIAAEVNIHSEISSFVG